MDILSIHNLEVWTHIGVPEKERKHEQRILVSMKMELDVLRAGKTDDVTKSINYDDVAKAIRSLAKKERKTIEAFAEEIAALILHDFAPHAITVTVKKYVLPDAESTSLTIRRP